jgi:hypothetical protein
MDIFGWFLFGPFVGLLFFGATGAALVYFALGVQNIIVGGKEKNQVKQKSGWGAVLISFGIILALFLVWDPLGGKIFFWWFNF